MSLLNLCDKNKGKNFLLKMMSQGETAFKSQEVTRYIIERQYRCDGSQDEDIQKNDFRFFKRISNLSKKPRTPTL